MPAAVTVRPPDLENKRVGGINMPTGDGGKLEIVGPYPDTQGVFVVLSGDEYDEDQGGSIMLPMSHMKALRDWLIERYGSS